MTSADAIRLVEILIWPLIALVATVVVGSYQLARLAIIGRGMDVVREQRPAEVRGFKHGS